MVHIREEISASFKSKTATWLFEVKFSQLVNFAAFDGLVNVFRHDSRMSEASYVKNTDRSVLSRSTEQPKYGFQNTNGMNIFVIFE